MNPDRDTVARWSDGKTGQKVLYVCTECGTLYPGDTFGRAGWGPERLLHDRCGCLVISVEVVPASALAACKRELEEAKEESRRGADLCRGLRNHAEQAEAALKDEREKSERLGGAAEMLAEFHVEADDPDTNALWLRGTLHREESDELIEALQQWVGQTGTLRIRLGDKFPKSQDGIRKAVARELADVVYVAYGTALIAGIDLDVALREVHQANMQKVREGHRREDGKIIKGPDFQPPDMSAALNTPLEGEWPETHDLNRIATAEPPDKEREDG